MSKLTQRRLKELLHYNSGTGIFTWKVSRNQFVLKNCIAGSKTLKGYYVICVDRKHYYSHRLVWLYYNGYLPENQIDHINQNKGDNRIENLRVVSQQCNSRNCGNRVTNTSGVKGVGWNKRYNKWYAYIDVNDKHRHLGGYKNFYNAVCARLAGEQCLNWSNCDSSSPAYQYVKNNIQRGKMK